MGVDLLTPFFSSPQRLACRTDRDWEHLLGQARRAGLMARLASQLVTSGQLALAPQRARKHLESALRLVERQRQEVTWEVQCIQRALVGVETPIVLLKGAAYLLAGLPPAAARLFSDVDILVRRAQLAAVESALFGAGWIVEARDPYTQRYYRDWMHELPPMRHVHRGTVIDVHHTIAPPTSRFKVDGERLLAQVTPVAGLEGVFVLAPVDMVLHSATHLFQEGEFWHGLRDLLDLHDLIVLFAQDPSFWPALLDRAAALQLQIPLSHALTHLERMFGPLVPADCAGRARALDRRSILRPLMAALLRIALRPEHPSCDGPWSKPARFLLYVRSHHLRMPMHLVVPHLLRKAFVRTEVWQAGP